MKGARLAESEKARIRAMWPSASINEIARALNCGWERVARAAKALDLPPKLRRTSWSADEDAALLARWDGSGATATALAAALGRSVGAVRSRHSALISGAATQPVASGGGHLPPPLPRGAAGLAAAHAASGGAAGQRTPRARCPFCEAPPRADWCRHGWDGETTRAMRREAAERIAAARTPPQGGRSARLRVRA